MVRFELQVGRSVAAVEASEKDTIGSVVEAIFRGPAQDGTLPPNWAEALRSIRVVVKGKTRAPESRVEAFATEGVQHGAKLKGRVTMPPTIAAAAEALWLTCTGKTEAAGANHGDDDGKYSGQSEVETQVTASQKQELPEPLELVKGALRLIVQQGSESYTVFAPCVQWSVGELKVSLQSIVGVDPRYQKLLINGKIRQENETLEACGLSPPGGKAMLLYHEGYHRAVDGTEYLTSAQTEISRATRLLETIEKQRKHNMTSTSEIVVSIECSLDRLENYMQGLDGRPVIPSMEKTKAEVIDRLRITAKYLLEVKKQLLRPI